MNRISKAASAFVAFALVSCVAAQATTTINFDNLTTGHKQGNVISGEGIKFNTCQSPNAISLGSVITLTGCVDGFQILANSDAVSPPNFAAADPLGTTDVLMTFTSPVNFVELYSDVNKTEGPDTIRLLALEPTGTAHQFKVVNYYQSLDNKTGVNGDNRLNVATPSGSFSAALFQTLTEPEGFDNLSFTTAPCRPSLKRFCYKQIVGGMQWVPVGCESFDCCPGCPGNILDWIVWVEGDPMDRVVLRFENLSPEAQRSARIEGNAVWLDANHLEIRGGGMTSIHGLRADFKSRMPAEMRPRATVERVVEAGSNGMRRTGMVQVRIEQKVGDRVFAKTQRSYRYMQ
jgi:hypothetical protein